MSDAAFDEVFDFVVVGSGGGSMAASLVVRSEGKSVVILEKASLVGGTTARSGGVMWIPNNRFMAEDGVEDSFEKSVKYMDATAGQSADAPGASPERRRAYVREAPAMVDFLVEQGIKLRRVPYYPDYYDDRAGGSAEGRTVVAQLFDLNELGPWAKRLQPSFLKIAGNLEDLFWLATFTRSWVGKKVLAKVSLKAITGKLTGKHWVTCGAALQGRMLQASLKAGVDVRTESPVQHMILGDGKVLGVVTTKDERPWRIGARLGVLINAGGFSHNQAMRDTYQPGTSAKWTGTTAGDTGEMLVELMSLGAATAQMEEMVGNQFIMPPGNENTGNGVELGKVGGQMDLSKPHAILVDQSGLRYQNEAGSYMEFCQNQLKRNRETPAIPSWVIVDTQFMSTYMLAGTMPGSKKPKNWFETGFLKKSDTIEGLAEALAIDAPTLKATVDRWNVDVRNGRDTQFHRGDRAYDRWLGDPLAQGVAQTLGTIDKAPFYAMPMVPGDVGTYGGVVTDTNARVLREDGSVIEGLYATGISTASVMGRYYPGAGSSVGPSFVWGYVAARHATQHLQQPPLR